MEKVKILFLQEHKKYKFQYNIEQKKKITGLSQGKSEKDVKIKSK